MKKLSFILTGILLTFTGLSQSCLPDGIDFTSQSQVDNFQTLYPGCTQIEGGVEINGDDITNLNGLSVVTSIGGQLYITSNEILNDISGLASLTYIGASLLISSNQSLTGLTGLANLSVVEGDVFISNNPVLTDISALGNIIAENVEELWITSNITLATCDNPFICNYLSNPTGTINIKSNAPGCNNPPEVADDCGITLPCLPNGNYNFFTQADIDDFQLNYPGCIDLDGEVIISGSDIINLAGLDVVNSINGSLKVSNNPLLASLAGLDSITSIFGPLILVGNDFLTDISALSHIDTSTISFLNIGTNPLLSECDIMSVCDYLSGPFGASHNNITGNADGCKNRDEVLLACLVGIDENMDEEVHLRISPNPSSSQITIETSGRPAKFQFSIFNLNGQEVIQQVVSEAVTAIDIAFLPAGIYIVRLEGAQSISVKKFVRIE